MEKRSFKGPGYDFCGIMIHLVIISLSGHRAPKPLEFLSDEVREAYSYP